MYFVTTVRLVLDDAPDQGIPGAMVSLYDRDRVTRDDRLGTEMTDTHGEAVFRFNSDHFVDDDDRLGGVMPELYAEVYDDQGQKVLSTRLEAISNSPRKLMTVPVPRALAEQHQLLREPRREIQVEAE